MAVLYKIVGVLWIRSTSACEVVAGIAGEIGSSVSGSPARQEIPLDQLDGKVAVITGAGNGIGRALAVRLASEGMRIALGDIDVTGMEMTADQIEKSIPGAETHAVHVDVRDATQIDAFADEVFATWGQVDLLCNNAGVFVGGYLWDRPTAELELALGVNLWGILHGIRAFVPRMIAQNTDGHIVNTASIAGLFGSPFSGPYNVSKFAAFAASEALANDLIASGSKLRASVLCPGIINTNIARDARDRPDRTGIASPADQRFVTDLLVDMVDHGKDPSEAASRVVEGIHAQDFLILTHDHHAGYLRNRGAELSRKQLPSIADYS